MTDENYLEAALADCEHVIGGQWVRVEYAEDFGDWTVVCRESGVVPVTRQVSALEAIRAADLLGRDAVEAYLADLLANRTTLSPNP